MKKIYFVFLAAGLISFASCSNEDVEIQNDEGVKTITSLTATIGDLAATRAFLSNNGTTVDVVWNKDSDEIGVYSDVFDGITYYNIITCSGNTAVFQGDPVTGSTFYAVYPHYGNMQVHTDNPEVIDVDPKESVNGDESYWFGAPMVATSTDGTNFAFKQTTGLIHIQVGNLAEIDGVYIRGNMGEPLAGAGYIDISETNPVYRLYADDEHWWQPVSNGYIVNPVLEEGEFKDIYFIIPPQTLQRGFTLHVHGWDTEGNEVDFTKRAAASLTVERANVYEFTLVKISEELVARELLKEEIETALTDAYAFFFNTTKYAWMGYGDLTNFVFGDVAGGDANKGSQASDQVDFTSIEGFSFDASNSYITGKWNTVYEGVRLANKVLDLLTKADGVNINIAQTRAQAMFIKSVWMFEGIKMFGAAIPYVSLYQYQANPETPVMSNMDETGNYKYVWSQVENDLKIVINLLPESWEDADNGRATSWMAKALLAKLYVYWSSPYNGTNATANHWADAKSLLDEIIDSGRFMLSQSYEDLFNPLTYNMTSETIFDIQLNQVTAILPVGALGIGGWGFYQPTYEFVNSYMVDNDGLPLSNYTNYAPLTQLDNIYNPTTDLTIYTDPRLDIAVGRFGVPYWDYGIPDGLNGWIRNYTYGGLYIDKKYQLASADRFYATADAASRHYHVIRYADILLMRAECAIEEGDLATAQAYINQVRERAARTCVLNTSSNYVLENLADDTTIGNAAANYRVGLYSDFTTVSEARKALERERRAEFGMEGHRWFDLARWGTAASELNAFRAYEGGIFAETSPNKYPNEYQTNWVTFPIPTTAIENAEGSLVQNANWN